MTRVLMGRNSTGNRQASSDGNLPGCRRGRALSWVSLSPLLVPVTPFPSPYLGPQSLAAPAKFPGNVLDKGLALMTPSHQPLSLTLLPPPSR